MDVTYISDLKVPLDINVLITSFLATPLYVSDYGFYYCYYYCFVTDNPLRKSLTLFAGPFTVFTFSHGTL